MEEVWKDIDFIVESDGTCAYQVSNLGNVRRAKEVVSIVDVNGLGSAGYVGRYTRRLKPAVLKNNNTYTKGGKQRYSFVSIKDVTYAVHTLVAKMFLKDSYEPGLVVNHKDGNKHNNCVDNLEWVTQSDNERHSYDILGKQPWNKGTKGLMPKEWKADRKAKYTERNTNLLADYKAGLKPKELAVKYGICREYVRQLLKEMAI